MARLLEGALSKEERAGVELHAAECFHCRHLLILSARTLEGSTPLSISSWRGWAAAAAVVVAAALVWLSVSRPPTAEHLPLAGGGAPSSADAGSDREQITAAMKGLVKRGYQPIEVTRLVARTAGAGIRGQDMVELVRAIEKAACDRKDPSRLRDEVIEAAASGLAGPELRRIIQDRLQRLPILQETDDGTNG